SAVRLVRPLHGRARAVAFLQGQFIAHAELVAIANDRRARQSEEEAVGQFDAPPIATKHWRQPAADAAIIELHILFRPERVEDLLSLLVRQSPEVELIVIAQEQ